MQSQSVSKIVPALIKAQGEMPIVKKESTNPFYKSKYADLPSIWHAVRGILFKNGLCVSHSTKIENGQAVLVTTVFHESGEWLSGDYPLAPVKNDPQGMGSAVSYAKRYALSALIGLVTDTEDDDGEAAMARQSVKATIVETKNKIADWKEKNGATTKTITEEQQKALFKAIKDCGLNEDQFKSYLDIKGWKATKEIPADQYNSVLEWIRSVEVAF